MAQASSSNAGYGIEDVYKSVINDVISGVKEIFLDESVDEAILEQLKSEWEKKLNASGALNYHDTRNIQPPPLRQPQQIKNPISQLYAAQPMPGPSNFVQPQRVIPQPQRIIAPPQQIQSVQPKPIPKPAIKQDYVKQMDGGGPGMTDSSSSEDEEDEDDQMSRFIGIQDEHINDIEIVDEEPLNSNDDQSDEEDLETLFQADNVIVCQFEKVNRTRTKWKFTLKDGIMHVNGKDYCFQKCNGEAEW